MDLDSFKNNYEKVKVEENHNSVASKPLVSVCIQTYQHVDYIKECLDSILNQKTNFEFEILLGEDNSSDGTREICKEYAIKYPGKIRLFLHHRENNIKILGTATGRFNWSYNLYSSRGRYIALCEGDDYWTDINKLQSQVKFLEENQEYSACFTNARIEQMDDIRVYNKNYFSESTDKDFHFKDIALRGGGLFPTAGLVFRNNLFELPSFFPDILSGDRALALLLGQNGKFRLLNKVSCVYRVHSAGMFSGNLKNIESRLKIFQNNILLLNNFDSFSKFRFHKEISNAISLQSKKILINSRFKLNKSNLRAYSRLNLGDWISYLKHIIIK